jgi:hypothetical protein
MYIYLYVGSVYSISIFSEKVNKLKIKSSVGDLLSRGDRRIRFSLCGETNSHAGDTVTGSE